MTKRILLALAVALAVVGSFLPRRAAADEVSFSFFYDNLSPYGAWIDVDGYGTCWQPAATPADWAPYTDGSWVYTDAGWTWVSNEDFGEIVYHYGRWVRLEGLGWIWRPDTEWGPAWVSWRSSDDYIGWAPLPPEAPFRAGIGISGWIDDSLLGPLSYSFCMVEDFGAPRLRHVLFGRERNVSIIHSTTNITHISVNHVTKTIYNGGPDYHSISKRSRRHIERLRLDRRTSASDYRRGGRAVRSHGSLVVHAPRVKNDFRHAPKVNRKWSNAKVDRGWKGVSAAERQRWETKVRHEQRQRSSGKGSYSAPSGYDYHNGRKDARSSSRSSQNSNNADRHSREKRDRERSANPPSWSAPRVKSSGNERHKDAERARKDQEKAFKKQQEKARSSSRQVEKRRDNRDYRETPQRQESRSSDRQRSKQRSSSSRDDGRKKQNDRGRKQEKKQDRKKESRSGKKEKRDDKRDKKGDKKKR